MKPVLKFPSFPTHFQCARSEGWHPKEIAQYERAENALPYVKSWDVAIDVGANMGTWSYAFAHLFATVHAFEPGKESYTVAVHNLAPFSNVIVHQAALFNQDGEGTMERAAFEYLSFGTGDTEVRTLDSFDLPSCGLLKIDAEGADYFVLRGARRTIKRHAPVIIVEEKEDIVDRYDLPRRAVYNVLDSFGYTRVWAHSPDAIYVHE